MCAESLRYLKSKYPSLSFGTVNISPLREGRYVRFQWRWYDAVVNVLHSYSMRIEAVSN